MLKDILISSAEILNRNDIIKNLKSVNNIDEITDPQIQNDVIRLINYYNFIIKSIFQDYLSLTFTDELISNDNNKIFFYNFSHEPVKINYVTDILQNKVYANIFTDYLLVNSSNKTYLINYNYTPEDIINLNDNTNLPQILNKKIICYGIASEFLASKNMFNESDYWKNKFMYEIFKFKTHKERRLKSVF